MHYLVSIYAGSSSTPVRVFQFSKPGLANEHAQNIRKQAKQNGWNVQVTVSSR
jgi:hypothetical protein